jgi:cellobiose transport system substrate-binding protein
MNRKWFPDKLRGYGGFGSFIRWMVLIVLSVMLVACGSSSGGNEKGSGDGGDSSGGKDETVELTMWTWNRSIDEEAIREYERMNPHITVNLQYADQGDVHNNLITAFSSGSGAPDVVGIEIQYVERFKANPEHFYNLYDLGAAAIEEDYLDWKWAQALTPDGQYLLALPIDIGPMAMAYRTDVFEAAGLPTDPDEVAELISTWDQFIEVGEQVLAKTGIPMINEIEQLFTVVSNQSDIRYFDRENRLVIEENEQVLRAWNLAVEAHKRGLSANIETFSTEWGAAMNNGDYAVQFAPAWMMLFMKENAVDSEGIWALTMMPEGGGNWGGSFLGIPKQSQHPEEAFAFISWLLAPEQQLAAFERVDLFPSTPGIYGEDALQKYTDPFFATPDVGRIYTQAAEQVIAQYLGPRHTVVNDIVADALRQIDDGAYEPDAAWSQALEEIERQLSR